ncbi:MAG: hypothetical protein FWH40_04635 [Coriobacteriia bacterium]|nr:hypothetical protein [Coriobacteriia bacterium]
MRKILIFLLALVMASSVAACSNKDNDDSSNQTASQNSEEQQPGENNTNESDMNVYDPQGNKNLVPIGKTVTAEFTNNSGAKHTVSMSVDAVVRGDDALSFINDTMMGNKSYWVAQAPDDESQEYIVLTITYTLVDYSEGDIRDRSSCRAFTGTFEPYPALIATMYYDADNGYPQLSRTEITVGETITGYEVFQIRVDDDAPTMAYECRLADMSDGLWFKLY